MARRDVPISKVSPGEKVSRDALDTHPQRGRMFQPGMWVRTTQEWLGCPAGALAGEVIEVSLPYANGVYNLVLRPLQVEGQNLPGKVLLPAEYAEALGARVEVGQAFSDWINQGDRECVVLEIKRTRARIEFEMPNCLQRGWRPIVRVCGQPFWSVLAERQPVNRLSPFPELEPREEAAWLGAPCRPATADRLVRRHTGFDSFEQMLANRPTLEVSNPERKLLADAYDHLQAARGVPCRVDRRAQCERSLPL